MLFAKIIGPIVQIKIKPIIENLTPVIRREADSSSLNTPLLVNTLTVLSISSLFKLGIITFALLEF
jgi:hypothetical protein